MFEKVFEINALCFEVMCRDGRHNSQLLPLTFPDNIKKTNTSLCVFLFSSLKNVKSWLVRKVVAHSRTQELVWLTSTDSNQSA